MKHLMVALMALLAFNVSAGNSINESQTQETFNTLQQSPTMAMSGVNNNQVINNSSKNHFGITLGPDGGFNLNGTCASDVVFVTGGVGNNHMESSPGSYTANSWDANVQVGYVKQVGEVQNNCEEMQRLGLVATNLALGQARVNICLNIINKGIDINVLAEVDPNNYGHCPRLAHDAFLGYHGAIAKKAVEQYVAKREANMRKLGVQPSQEHVVYQK